MAEAACGASLLSAVSSCTHCNYDTWLCTYVVGLHKQFIHDVLCCTRRAKLDLPLVSPGQLKVPWQQDSQCKTIEPASARIADREQPYLASVPLLQDSYLFGVADWYSLVTTLLNSHWDTICSACIPASPTADTLNKAPLTSQQDLGSDWMSWGWLQSFFQGLNAQHRQVLECCLYLAGSI